MAKRQFAVIGLGRFGSAVASTLVELGQDVIGIDSDEAKVNELTDKVPHLMVLNAMDPKALGDIGIGDFDVAVVSIGENIEASLLIVMTVKDLGVKYVMAKATTALHGRILEKLGVNRVVYPEREMATRLAHSLVVPNVIDYIGLSEDFSIIELPAPLAFFGRTLREIDLRAKYGLTLIAIKRPATEGQAQVTNVAPAADERIKAGDTLAMVGSNEKLAEFERQLVKS